MHSICDIHYGKLSDARLALDLHMPEGACRATLVYVHGGGIESGDKSGEELLRRALTEKGIAVATINYRMYPDAVYPQFLEDTAEAVAWVHGHAAEYGLGSKIFLGGSSAGGYISMMLCFAPEFLNAQGMKPEDLAGYILDAGQPTAHFNVLKYRGLDSRRVIVDETAPLYHVQSAAPSRPLLILVTDDDIPCRLEQNRLLYRTLLHFGYPEALVELKVLAGYHHCAYLNHKTEDGRYPYGELVTDFIARNA